MPPPKMRALPTLSCAAQQGDRLHLQLQLSDPHAAGPTPFVRLHQDGRPTCTAPVRLTLASGSDLAEADLPLRAVGTGTWRLEIGQSSDGNFRPFPAFVLISDRNPVALLLGQPAQPTEGAAPRPIESLPTRRSVALADRLLAELSPARARRYRARLRRAARRVVPRSRANK